MAGLTKPRWRPAYWSARAITPAQVGALALLPPLLRIVYPPRPSLMTIVMPVCGLAPAATSGTPRLAPLPGTPCWEAGRVTRRLKPPPGAWTQVPGGPEGRPQAGPLAYAP